MEKLLSYEDQQVNKDTKSYNGENKAAVIDVILHALLFLKTIICVLHPLTMSLYTGTALVGRR